MLHALHVLHGRPGDIREWTERELNETTNSSILTWTIIGAEQCHVGLLGSRRSFGLYPQVLQPITPERQQRSIEPEVGFRVHQAWLSQRVEALWNGTTLK